MRIILGKVVVALSAVLVGLSISIPSHAGLIGQSLTHECPQCGPPYSQAFVVTQGLGPELTPFDQWQLDVEDSTIRMTFLIGGPLIDPLDFIVSGILGGITSVTIDPSSTVQPVALSFTQSSIDMNFNGGPNLRQGMFWLLNVNQETNNEVPEPETYALILTSLGLIGIVRRRKQRVA